MIRFIVLTAISSLLFLRADAIADKPRTLLKKRYAEGLSSCGLPGKALEIILNGQIEKFPDIDNFQTLPDRSSTDPFFDFYTVRPQLKLPRPVAAHQFSPSSSSGNSFLWLPLPQAAIGTTRHIAIMNCRTLFDMALKAEIDITWLQAKAAAKLSKEKQGRFTGRYGVLQSPLWRRLGASGPPKWNAYFLLWLSLAQRWESSAPPMLWSLRSVKALTFDAWEQISFSGNLSLDLDHGIDAWFFEEQIDASVRADLSGESSSWRSLISIAPGTEDWGTLPEPAALKEELQKIVPERDPEDHGDETALQGQTFRNVRVIPGLPKELCNSSNWSVSWQDSLSSEHISGDVKWNVKGYCSFAASTKIPSSAFVGSSANATFLFRIKWIFLPKINKNNIDVKVESLIPLEGDLVSSSERNAYDGLVVVGGRIKQQVIFTVSDPKNRLDIGQPVHLRWPKDPLCGWSLVAPAQASFLGKTFSVELVFESPSNDTATSTVRRCSLEVNVKLSASDRSRTPTEVTRSVYVLLDLPVLTKSLPPVQAGVATPVP